PARLPPISTLRNRCRLSVDLGRRYSGSAVSGLGGVSSMKRRQMRWILVLVPTVVALCLMVVAPVADAVPAHATPFPAPSPAAPATFAPPVGALLVPP